MASRKNTSRTNKTNKRIVDKSPETTTVRVSRPEDKRDSDGNGLFDRIQNDLQHNQSYLNLILGGLIAVVLGVLLWNYFTKPNNDLIPAQQTETADEQGDVSKDKLPGSYKVKTGDTLFTIAEKYYGDGYKYTRIREANSLANENSLTEGQMITIPKDDDVEVADEANKSANPSPTEVTSPVAVASPDTMQKDNPEQAKSGATPTTQMTADTNDKGTGGAENQTIWGEKISGDTYTVQTGDWLSKVAGRVYGDPTAYQKIAQANNIQNADIIEVGTVLKIP